MPDTRKKVKIRINGPDGTNEMFEVPCYGQGDGLAVTPKWNKKTGDNEYYVTHIKSGLKVHPYPVTLLQAQRLRKELARLYTNWPDLHAGHKDAPMVARLVSEVVKSVTTESSRLTTTQEMVH